MNNLLSYCGLINAKIRASNKDLPVQWNIKETLAVDENAFVLFELLHPKPDIVFFGYGAKSEAIRENNSGKNLKQVCIS